MICAYTQIAMTNYNLSTALSQFMSIFEFFYLKILECFIETTGKTLAKRKNIITHTTQTYCFFKVIASICTIIPYQSAQIRPMSCIIVSKIEVGKNQNLIENNQGKKTGKHGMAYLSLIPQYQLL